MGLDISNTENRKKHVIPSESTSSLHADEPIQKRTEKEEKIEPSETLDMSSYLDIDTLVEEDDEAAPQKDEVKEETEIHDVVEDEIKYVPAEPEPDVVKVHPDDIEVYKEPLTEEEIDRMGNTENIRYKSGDVAKRLGVSDQVIRNYAEQYDCILHVEKTSTGHRRFTEENIEQLKLILQLKHEKGLTVEQTIEFFQSQDKPLNKLTTEMKFDVLLQLISERVNESIVEALAVHAQKEKQQQLLIEQYDKSVAESKETITALTETIKVQNQQILEQSKQLEELKQKYEAGLEDQQQAFDDLSEKIREIMDKKEKPKKGIFGIFK